MNIFLGIAIVLAFILVLKSFPKDKCKDCSACATDLVSLKIGQCGVITHVPATGNIARRLADMGVVPGQRICLIRAAPLGNPLEYCVMGYNLALRTEEAQTIKISVIEIR